MCDVCGRYICPSNCPNAADPPKFGECVACGAEINEGDDYYDINDELWCEDCIFEARKTAGE